MINTCWLNVMKPNEFKVFDLIIKSGLDQKYPEIIDEYVFFKISQYFEKQTKYH